MKSELDRISSRLDNAEKKINVLKSSNRNFPNLNTKKNTAKK